ncbi:hypothetical protein L1987_52634 [Smallanthus sonchifolius]|uniref:Uncharacterized protein n=1 Tax=Smallanthus sonchifolius TaxID=185202 RepID=A0ACB9ETC7_9ASTR|nr:hypothetical protein L1987_52634 [Smallanthus sonchifolius]
MSTNANGSQCSGHINVISDRISNNVPSDVALVNVEDLYGRTPSAQDKGKSPVTFVTGVEQEQEGFGN